MLVRLMGIGLSVAAAAFANSAVAADVAYSFSTGVISPFAFSSDNSTRGADIAARLAGSSVSGSFLYDSTSPATGTTLAGSSLDTRGTVYSVPTGTLHSSFTALSGVLAGAAGGPFSFGDPRGFTIVGNDADQLSSCGPQPCTPPMVDYFQFQTDSSSASIGTHNIVPFTITAGGTSYTLFNARLFWIESVTGSPPDHITQDFLSSNDLLPAPPSFEGRLALDFVVTGNPAGPQYDVFFDGLAVTAAVPEAETYAMLMTGFGLLGFIARRKKKVIG